MKRRKRAKKRGKPLKDLLVRTLKSRLFQRFMLSLVVLVVVSATGLYLYGLLKRGLSLRHFVVMGNTHLADNEVVSLMGLKRGVSLLDIDPVRLRRRLLKSPWIKAVLIRRQPPHSLIVLVKEATPVAILKRKNSLFLVDGEGVLLERIEQSPSFLPVISVKGKNRELLSQVLLLARAVRRFDYFNDQEIEIIAKRPEDISLKVNGLLIKIGKGQYTEKLKQLVTLRDRIEKIKVPIDYIDLRFRKRLIVRPVKRLGNAR
ncbi:MAG: FtsQ-type POTRA domain-containing protein [Nitrospirae bacterium]|nr:MAG: FtsQ-type POTRA domain-containing protein [Nitrospirota bacterium]